MSSSSTRGHIAERTCISCRQVKPKRELIRLVGTTEGEIQIDRRGKKSGRGAYLCKNRQCWEAALKGGKKDPLAHSLKVPLDQQNRSALLEYGKRLPSATLAGEKGI